MHLFSTAFLLYLHGFLLALVALGSADSDVDFMSVRAKFLKDYSGKGGEPGEKYFTSIITMTDGELVSSPPT
ncbi:mannosyltransferase [Aspergillus fumigatus]